MSDFLTWRDEWRTGIDWIDADHRAIAELLNQLVAMNDCAARASLAPDPDAAKGVCLATLDALIEQARRHYQAEETFLREICFPGYSAHRHEHILQLAEFTDLRRSLEQDASPFIDPEVVQDFKLWFFNHVMSEDRDYVNYFQGQMQTGGSLAVNAAAVG
jgi:hemerythrin